MSSTSVLNQLKDLTIVVADTGDIESIERFKPRDATTNPSLIASAAQMPKYAQTIDDTLKWARDQAGSDATADKVITLAIDRLSVAIGLRILEIIKGRVSTEVDARLSYNVDATIDKARQLIAQYEEAGVSRERVLIKIASTWEGICAAKELEKEGIHCNLTLLFGLHQAIASAEVGVTLISPFVGRILDWYKKSTGATGYAPSEDPGVKSVTQIYNYYKHFGYKTEVMAASFRNIEEICELAGCDLMTISPNFLDDLQQATFDLPLKLEVGCAKDLNIEKIDMNEETFNKMHAANKMAEEKTKEGIEGFSKAIESLETQLKARLATLEA